ncbi:unnamed protein product [Durusdinium trenchii]|uniref:K Homology domain-containing protein n=1 Tax=Durusdinium trenchii TaxID=1381693 RepID=A0ABP0PBG7_9DINO
MRACVPFAEWPRAWADRVSGWSSSFQWRREAVAGRSSARVQWVKAEALSSNYCGSLQIDAPEPEPFENKSHGTFISAYSEPEAKRPRPSAAAPRTTSESTKILVPANVAGAIIGKQGSTLKQIRESSGASIDVVKETQTPEFPGERVVNVRGSLDVRRNALPQVLTAAFEKDPANALIKMMVPSNLVGGIIGRQGANLKAIREQCGIHVQVGQKDQQTVHGERMVFATGGLEQVLSAAALVLDSAEVACVSDWCGFGLQPVVVTWRKHEKARAVRRTLGLKQAC